MVANDSVSTRVKVLIIDDDLMVCESLNMLFTHYGWESLTVNSGDEALARFPRYEYSLAIVDHRMDGMDGVEIIKRLKARSDAPVFMLTGCIDPKIRLAASYAGVDGYFIKPAQIVDIIEAYEALF